MAKLYCLSIASKGVYQINYFDSSCLNGQAILLEYNTSKGVYQINYFNFNFNFILTLIITLTLTLYLASFTVALLVLKLNLKFSKKWKPQVFTFLGNNPSIREVDFWPKTA